LDKKFIDIAPQASRSWYYLITSNKEQNAESANKVNLAGDRER